MLTTIPFALVGSAGCVSNSGDEEEEEPPYEDERVRWWYQTEDLVRASPVLVDGRLYVGSLDGVLRAFDAEDGSLHWQFDTEGEIHNAVAIADKTIYVGSLDSRLYALDFEGVKQWSVEVGDLEDPGGPAGIGGMQGGPTVVDDTVYVGDFNGTVAAIDAADGTRQWTHDLPGQIIATPVVRDGVLYLGAGAASVSVEEGAFYAIDATDGTRRWRFETGDIAGSDAAVTEDRVFFGSKDSIFYALDRADGRLDWSHDTGHERGINSKPAVVEAAASPWNRRTLYYGDQLAYLYALDAETGEVRWESSDPEGSFNFDPLVQDGTLYVGDGSGFLRAYDAETGDPQWTFETYNAVHSTPIVTDDTIYFGSTDTRFYAIERPYTAGQRL